MEKLKKLGRVLSKQEQRKISIKENFACIPPGNPCQVGNLCCVDQGIPHDCVGGICTPRW